VPPVGDLAWPKGVPYLVPSAPGKLYLVACFGAEQFCVHRCEEKSTTIAPASFASGEEVLLGLRSHVGGTAEIVLIIEFPS
jgi:hypothetical protein